MEKKKGFVSAFIDGAKNGYQICMTSTLPNVMFAFILIRLLNLTGLSDLIGAACAPAMGIFGLPGIAATVIVAALISFGGSVGMAASLYTSNMLSGTDITILIPGIMLMGTLIQYMGRILGTAGLPKKYYPIPFAAAFFNAAVAMLITRFIIL